MNEQTRQKAIFGGAAIALLGAASYMLFFRGQDNPIPESTGKTIYYTGPMKSKGGGGGYGTIDGRQMTAEEGEAAAQKWLKEHPGIDPGTAAPKPSSPASNDQNVN